ncbi:MAG: FkbM family methyltransferase [Planctomycetota bacterium]
MRPGITRLLRDILKEVQILRRDGTSCYLGNDTVLTRVRGFKMVCPSDDMGMTPHLVLDGCWEMAVTRVFESHLEPGMTAIDIGANIGYFTLTAARRVGPTGVVHAFEPEPRNLWHLRHNVSLNGFGQVRINDKALWHETGHLTLRTTDESSGGHSLVGVDPALLDEDHRVRVETVTLDEYLGDEKHVDVIKMDAEGAEPFIWEGMTETLAANPRLKVLMEFAPDFVTGAGRDYHEYLAGLEAKGFSIGLIESDVSVSPIDLSKLDELIPTRGWPQMLMLERRG